ncbi:MAG: 6-hydroxymethylpterin diphosphokinase MptE-like protein [Spirochaetaceae bacterium]
MHHFVDSKNGEPTVRFRGTLLHSSYNPSREARRFAERAPEARCYLILGGGLGHLATALAGIHPRARVCTLHPSRELAAAASTTPGVHGSPESRDELLSLLNAAFGREGAYGFEVLPWEPAATAAPEWFREQETHVLSVAREWHDTLVSTGYFGFRWLRNTVRNLTAQPATPKPFRIPRDRQPVLVAPGPTLDDDMPWLRRERSKILLFAVSSAWPILFKRGIEPDLLLHTDGGFWATGHLRGARGCGSPPLAASMRAALPEELRECTALYLIDPTSAVDRALSSAVILPSLPLPGHGTVSGSALRLISTLLGRPPLLLGLDLAVRGLRSHARGHAFEPLIHAMISRLAPLPTLLRGRLGEAENLDPPWQQPRDLRVYAASLSAELGRGNLGCRRLNPSPVDLSCQAIDPTWSPATPADAGAVSSREVRVEPNRQRGNTVGGVLRRWKELFRELTLSFFATPEQQDESTAFAEELSQMLALPELLRLRSALARENGSEEAFRSLKAAVGEKLERLIRSV